MKKTLLPAAFGAVLLLGACGGRDTGGTNDSDAVEPGDVKADSKADAKLDVKFPDGTVLPDQDIPVDHPIVQVQTSKDSVDCPPESKITNFADGLTGTAVVVTPKFVASKDKTTGQPKLDGYFVSVPGLDTSMPYTGIEVTVDSALGTNFQPGDQIDFVGGHVEYYCMSELGLDTVAPNGTSAVPKPLTVDPAVLGSQDPAKEEMYEGVLVRVANVEVTSANPDEPNDYGYFQVTGDLIVGNLFYLPYMAKATDARRVGDRFDEIVGVLHYTFGRYILMPRSMDDLVFAGGNPEPSPDVPPEGVEPDAAPETPGDVPVVDSGIAAIQQSSDSVNCPAGSEIATFGTGIAFHGVVVVSPRFNASGSLHSYFVADQGPEAAAFHGVQVTFPVADNTDFAPGDVIDFTADHVEYYCMTELKGSAASKTGTTPVPAPVEIDPCDLGEQQVAVAEPLEGVLVRVKDVTVENANPDAPKDYGSFVVDCGLIVSNTFKLPYMNKETSARTVGDKFSSITGIVAYSFGKYVLLPRGEEDMVKAGTATEPAPEQPVEPAPDAIENPDVAAETVTPPGAVAAIQLLDESAKCSTGDSSVTHATGLQLEAVVTSPRFDLSYTLHGFYVADQAAVAQPWGGMMVTAQKTLGVEVAPGDVVSLTGDHVEYYCLTELAATAVEKTGSATPPAPLDIDPCDVGGQDPLKAEPLEGTLVRVKDVTVTNANPDAPKDYGSFVVDCDLWVSNQFKLPYMNKETSARTVGDQFSQIVGFIHYNFGRWVLQPRSEADMVKVQ